MKKFVVKTLMICLVSIFLSYTYRVYLLIDSKYQEMVVGKEIYLSIKKSKKKSPQKKLIIGDSVCNQIFSNTNDNDSIFNSLACNQAIGLVGQYLLLKNYIEAGNEIDTVYFIFVPGSFTDNLNQVYTYHYFLKPFYRKEYKADFTQKVHEQIAKIPYTFLLKDPHIFTSNWSPDFVSKDTTHYTCLSPVSREYLNKIALLAEENNFTIVLRSPILNITQKGDTENINRNEFNFVNPLFDFDSYFEDITYLDESYFYDNVHFKNTELSSERLNYYRNQLTHIEAKPD